MSVSLLDLPKYVIQYMATLALDPRDTSHFRATCKTIYKGVKDTAKEYRKCTTMNSILHVACIGGHLEIAKWCTSNGATNFDRAMACACETGHLELAKWCASNGAKTFNYALHYTSNKYADVIKWLKEQIKKKFYFYIQHP